MVDKVKLGIWDFFAYVLSGTAVILSVLIHCICTGNIPFEKLEKIPSAVSAILVLLIVILIGLLLEPIANFFFKIPSIFSLEHKDESWFFKREMKFNFKEYDFKNWDHDINKLEKNAKEYLGEDLHGSIYHYCKNWALCHAGAEQFNSFLGKYGFYRNMFFVVFANAIACLLIYKSFLYFLIISLLALLYLHRSRVFYRHQSLTVYNNFIQHHMNLNKNKDTSDNIK